MILTCPSCSTRYFADAASLGPKGRSVRCASCGHTWRATAEEEPAPAVAEAAFGDADPLPEFDHPGEPPAPAPAAAPHKAVRAKAAERRRRARATAAGVAWGGVAGAFALILGAAYLFRVEVVSLWPRAASAYALAGVEARAAGLRFEDIDAERVLENGAPVLVVTASVRNPTGRARDVPVVRLSLRDQAGGEVYAWHVALEAEQLEPGASTRFAARLARPPSDAEDLELIFAEHVNGPVTPAEALDPPAHDAADPHGDAHGGEDEAAAHGDDHAAEDAAAHDDSTHDDSTRGDSGHGDSGHGDDHGHDDAEHH